MVKEFFRLKPNEIRELYPGSCRNCPVMKEQIENWPRVSRNIPNPNQIFELTDLPRNEGGNEMVSIPDYKRVIFWKCQLHHNPWLLSKLTGVKESIKMHREVVDFPLPHLLGNDERNAVGGQAIPTKYEEITKPYVFNDPHTEDVTDECPVLNPKKVEVFNSKDNLAKR